MLAWSDTRSGRQRRRPPPPAPDSFRRRRRKTPAQVFAPDTTQERLYGTAVAGIVEEVLEGFNCTIFACEHVALPPAC